MSAAPDLYRFLTPRITITPSRTPPATRVADRARRAVLALLAGAKDGWGKRELATWLVAMYAPVAQPEQASPSTERPRAPRPAIDPERVEQLVTETCDRVVDILAALEGNAGAFELLFAAVLADTSLEHDAKTGTGFFVPVNRPNMGLLHRVLSLIAVDYLARPSDYDTALRVCPDCGSVRFDASSDHAACRACNRTSDVY